MKTIAPTEKEFMASVLELARLQGWLCYHTHDSRRSTPGFPDLVLVRGDRLLFVELKTDKGKCSDAQWGWIHALEAAERVEVWVWSPRIWPAIEETLKGRSG